jgi:hypothetical protein
MLIDLAEARSASIEDGIWRESAASMGASMGPQIHSIGGPLGCMPRAKMISHIAECALASKALRTHTHR